MDFGIGHAQMHVPKRHAHLIVRRELRESGLSDEKCKHNQQRSHGGPPWAKLYTS